MKIMIITTPRELGGGETYVNNLIKGLPCHKFLVLTSLQEFNNKLKIEGIQSRLLIMSVKFLSRFHIVLFLILTPFNIIQYLWYLLVFNPDIVHIQSREEQILVTPIARILGKKVIWTLHGLVEKSNRVIDWMFLMSSLKVNRVIAISIFVEKSLKSYGMKSPISVIYHGVDLKRFKPAVFNNSQIIIGFIGRLVNIKRPEIFLDASIEMLQRLPQAQVWIVGDGNLKTKMENKVSTLAIKDRIKFLGFRQDTERIIRQFTILLITSQTEGLAISALEYIASGVPVVSVPVGALPEVVSKETGLLVDSDNPKIIAEQILSLIKDKNLLLKLKKTCRKVAEKKFSLDRMITETDLVYKV